MVKTVSIYFGGDGRDSVSGVVVVKKQRMQKNDNGGNTGTITKW